LIETVAIIGSGLAGAAVATGLRSLGFDGGILLFGDEAHHAYDRPCLSKAALIEGHAEPMPLHPDGWLERNRITLIDEAPVTAFDAASRTLTIGTGQQFTADGIVFATGLRPRTLGVPGEELAGVQYLRTWADQLAMRDALHPGMRLAIVGGGLVGCEIATTARQLGAEVTIYEAADELVARVLGKVVGERCRRNLRSMGVDVRLNTTISAIEGDTAVRGVHSRDGMVDAVDRVLVSIGGVPADDLAAAAGIECHRGIIVDAQGRTSHENVFAVGDVANWPLRDGTRRSRRAMILPIRARRCSIRWGAPGATRQARPSMLRILTASMAARCSLRMGGPSPPTKPICVTAFSCPTRTGWQAFRP